MAIGSIQGINNNPFLTKLPGLNKAEGVGGISPELQGKLDKLVKLGEVDSVKGPSALNTISPTGLAKAPSFGDALSGLIHSVDAKQKAAGVEARKLMAGETDNIHQSMIAVQESGLAFSLMLEVRNKLVESYQQIMRMGV